MRTFEIILLFVNLLSLVLSFKRPSKAAWLGAALVNLSVFALHGSLEGLRWQMAGSYLFAGLFALYALAKMSDRIYRFHLPGALKVISAGLAVVLVGVSAFLAYALPVFSLPKPTGSYAVGIQYIHLTDTSRADPFLDKTSQPRELMVKVYYPAQPDPARPFAPYFNGSLPLIRLLTTGYQMPFFMFDHLALVKTHSQEGVSLAEGQKSYPVVLFSHGAGTTMEVETAQCEDLASHGYIVAAVDHPYVSAGTVFPDHVVSAKAATTDFKSAEPAEIITQIMADDDQFVMDQLGQMNAGATASIFKGKLDLDHLGVMGHSVGGAVAYNLAVNEPRVKAAVDLDGVVFITPKAGAPAIAPFLMLANDRYHVQAIENRENLMQKFDTMPAEDQNITIAIYGSREAYLQTYTRAQQNLLGLVDVLKASGNLYTITGSDHMKFSDIGLFIGFGPLREMISISGATDPARCLAITEAVTVTFFDQHLKGVSSGPVAGLRRQYPELEKVELK